MLINRLQKLTKYLSIKQIVIVGVIIMAIVISIFSATMIFFTSTVKFDKTTLISIITLEEQNNHILKSIEQVNSLNTKILLSSSSRELDKLELITEIKHYKHLQEKIDKDGKYNKEIELLTELLQEKVILQKELFNSKKTIVQNQENLFTSIASINESINKLDIVTDSIASKALLATKRIIRKLKSSTKNDIDSYKIRVKTYNSIATLQALVGELNMAVLKLPMSSNTIINANNVHIVNHIDKNILSQINSLIESLYFRLKQEKIFYKNHKKGLEQFKVYFENIQQKQLLVVNAKKNVINQKIVLNSLIHKKEVLEKEVFKQITTLDNISKNIKYNILNNSDNTAKVITLIVISVSILFSILLILAASILIARINVPLNFITTFINEIGQQNTTIKNKLPIGIDDEFGQLSNSFNSMTTTIEHNIDEIKGLYEEIENTQKEIIFTMGAAGELRSKETGMHVKRVAEYSKLLALLYGLDTDEAELLKLASPMHDIGKVGIPDEILHKPGKLTIEEFEIMKTHAQLGYDMLKGSQRIILKSASIVAHEHHEKYNGKGYPRALKGEEIHIFGRITAVADVFDALGSERAYKKAWADEKILELFTSERGKHFDPKLIDLFIEHKEKFYSIRDKYKEEIQNSEDKL